MSTVFVTASGTEVGKTFVMCRLIRELRDARIDVRAVKPVSTGFDPDAAESSDAGRLLRAQGHAVTPENLDRVAPWRFAAPLSPDMAAAREGRSVPFEPLLEFCLAGGDRGSRHLTLIEGIGGVMVPLDERHTVLDWAAALDGPAVLVTGSYLGSISHTLTAAHALASRGVEIAVVIVSESLEQPVPLEETTAAIGRFAAGVPVVALPRGPASSGAPALAPLLEAYAGD